MEHSIHSIRRDLMVGKTIKDNNGFSWAMEDVREECGDMDDLLIQLSTSDNQAAVALDIRARLFNTAGSIAERIMDTWEDV